MHITQANTAYNTSYRLHIQSRYGHKNMRIRTQPLRSPQRGEESNNKRVLDNGRSCVRQLCSFQNDLLFLLRDKGPSNGPSKHLSLIHI